MILNKETIDLIKEFEGCSLTPYFCPAGALTIGYGYTNNSGFGDGVNLGDVWTQEKADKHLDEGVDIFSKSVQSLLKVTPTPNQLGAMTSLAYNIGTGAFSRSTCLKRFNKGDIEGAVDALMWFNKSKGKVLRGLVRRREAERDLFLGDASLTNDVGPVDEPKRSKSKTLTASSFVGLAGSAGTYISVISDMAPMAQYMLIGVFGVIAIAALVVFRERLKKAF